MNKLSSIRSKTLVYLIFFSVSILLALWVFQRFYFLFSYESYQVQNMNSIAKHILEIHDGDFNQNLENLAYKNNVCMEVFWNNNAVSTYNTLMVGCELGKNNSHITILQKEFLNSNQDTQTYRLENLEYKAKSYLYGIKTNVGTIFLYSPLKDLRGASIVLQNQLIYLTFIAILFACIIAYFLSKKLTNPILDITEKAKNLGKGNCKVTFSSYEIKEIDELSTVLQNAQEELFKTEELRRDLLANVSHDLKTPLTMIKAYAEMVRDISYADDEKRKMHCDVIVNESNRLNLLVNDILDLSKLQANVCDLHLETYDLVQEIYGVMKRYEIIKETENYQFILELPDSAIIRADKNKINQVLYNLINNAINYTGEDKVVKIRLKNWKDSYLVEIIDTGKGIKKKELPFIWEKYYKSEKNHQRNVVGSGIGLSIVKSILEQHHFLYGVRSKKSKGSTFYFYVNKV